jgi:hypothetical protein
MPNHPGHGPGRYEIRVKGHLDDRWASWFDGFSLTRAGDGSTVLAGRTDQAGLHGVLRKLGDIGLPLVSVTPAADDPSSDPLSDPR